MRFGRGNPAQYIERGIQTMRTAFLWLVSFAFSACALCAYFALAGEPLPQHFLLWALSITPITAGACATLYNVMIEAME